jgi:hypothetical protein
VEIEAVHGCVVRIVEDALGLKAGLDDVGLCRQEHAEQIIAVVLIANGVELASELFE